MADAILLGLLALLVFVVILYFVDEGGAGEKIFDKTSTVIFSLVGTVVGASDAGRGRRHEAPRGHDAARRRGGVCNVARLVATAAEERLSFSAANNGP